VLGTHFNVNAYDDETAVKVTLLEGIVKTSIVNGESSILKPGQQATVRSGGGVIQVKSNVDVDEVMAWKNGTFLMNRADIGSIMRQISRWYDVDVVYENGVPKGTISGEVPRNLNLSEVLKVYEYSGLHFRIEGRKIVVMQ
jgi:ferric-dicitrate binding protein FerR (iron transport regulator)